MLIRAKKHVLSSYSYSNLSFHRKITKTTQKWVVFFYTKIKRRRPQKNTANVHVRRGRPFNLSDRLWRPAPL